MDPNNPYYHQHEEPEEDEHPHHFEIAGHKISRRDIILASVAAGLLIFGVIAGLLGIFNGKPPQPAAQPSNKEIVDQADLLNHQWSFLPGASRQNDGLKIAPEGFVVVRPDGSGGQPNPPINLYGTYLEDVKDITITAELTPGSGTASIRLYSEPPIMAASFRDERKSIDLGVTGNVLSISTWDRAAPKTNTYTFDGKGKLTLKITRQNRILTFSVNDKQLAALPEGNIFSTSKLWFGADAMGDSWVLNSLRADALHTTRVTVVDASKFTGKQATDSFQALANVKRSDFAIGALMALGPMVADQEYRNVALGQFGLLVPENAMQWQFIHPNPTDYTFAEADALVDLASRSGLAVHGRVLVTPDANVPWLYVLPVATDVNKQQVEKVMTTHITQVATHFKGKVVGWDVVSEPLAATAGQGDMYTQNKWFQAMGKDYIATAFTTARQADPDAQLYLNEKGLEKDGPRWDAFLNMVGELKRQNVPINGVGLEARVGSAADKIDPAVLRKHIQQLKSLDLKTRISEMTVYSADGPENQSSQYNAVLDACLQEQTCMSFTVGGVANRYDLYKDASNATQHADDFLYDLELKPTVAANGLRDLLSR
jgi:endo-1,4-beta-xylanase